MKNCPPNCPNIKETPFTEDMCTKKASSNGCKKYNKRLLFTENENLERLECCTTHFKKITTYVCYFTFGTRELNVNIGDLKNTYGIEEFTNGFWINEDFKFTKGEDSLIWIPPSKIHYINKEVKEVIDEVIDEE